MGSTATGLAMAVFAWLFSLTFAADRIENQYALGFLYWWRGPLAPPSGAVVIAIDNQTIEWLRESAADPDRYPWLDCMPPAERRQFPGLCPADLETRTIRANHIRDDGARGLPGDEGQHQGPAVGPHQQQWNEHDHADDGVRQVQERNRQELQLP